MSKHHVWMSLGRSALGCGVLKLYLSTKGGDARFVDRYTDLVVEGYPRSANTQVVAALREANGDQIRLAHHFHASWQFIRAAQLGVPSLVLVRNPFDAIASLITRNPRVIPKRAFEDFVAFHEQVAEVIGYVVIATFQDATNSLDLVINRLNVKFGVQLKMPFARPGESPEVLARIDAMDLRDRRVGKVSAHTVARPSKDRSSENATTKRLLRETVPEDLIKRASELYSMFEDVAHKY